MNIGGKLYDMATGQIVNQGGGAENTGEIGNQTGDTGIYTPTSDSSDWGSWIDNWGGG